MIRRLVKHEMVLVRRRTSLKTLSIGLVVLTVLAEVLRHIEELKHLLDIGLKTSNSLGLQLDPLVSPGPEPLCRLSPVGSQVAIASSNSSAYNSLTAYSSFCRLTILNLERGTRLTYLSANFTHNSVRYHRPCLFIGY